MAFIDHCKANELRPGGRPEIRPAGPDRFITQANIHKIHIGDVQDMMDAKLPSAHVGLAWLGQAGFAVRYAGHNLLIDPYLSDFLAEKYRGKRFSHERMMRPPVCADALRDLDAVLCTHRHSDHMDPVTLPILAAQNPHCQFVVPRAERKAAEAQGIPPTQMITMDAGESLRLHSDILVTAIPSAHEELLCNNRREYHCLGYVLRFNSIPDSARECKNGPPEGSSDRDRQEGLSPSGETGGFTLYHSGDCVPYAGLVEKIRSLKPQLALLPVNGRDEFRQSHGVPGNMTLEEAGTLCHAAGIPWLVPHHFGMFAFNTLGPAELAEGLQHIPPDVHPIVPQIDTWLEIQPPDALQTT